MCYFFEVTTPLVNLAVNVFKISKGIGHFLVGGLDLTYHSQS